MFETWKNIDFRGKEFPLFLKRGSHCNRVFPKKMLISTMCVSLYIIKICTKQRTKMDGQKRKCILINADQNE